MTAIVSSSKLLYDSSLIPSHIQDSLPNGYLIRPLAVDDYSRGVLDVLRVLTTVGSISEAQFSQQFEYWLKRNDTYFTTVITNETNRVVAVGSIVVERKLIHECGLVGHIEDIAVSKDQQGKKLGIKLIDALTEIGRVNGAYKVILDCSQHNVAFYEKCGYKLAGCEMSLKFADLKQDTKSVL